MSSAHTSVSVPARLGNLMVWLGGGSWRDIDEPVERSGYQQTGFVVLLAALVAWGVATSAVASVGGPAVPAALAMTVVVGLLVGALGRVLASAPSRRWAVLGPAAVAVLVGAVLGELAALAIFTGPSGRALDEQAARAAATVSTGERATELTRLRAERSGLEDRVAQGVARRDEALLVARCEYRPSPGCPPQLITGEPGRGAEAEQARAALAGADADLAAARADRDRRAPELDRSITSAAEQVDRDRAAAEALARADTGPIAQWQAMNAYTLGHPSALVPRLAAVLTLVLVTLLPLLLRLMRGPSDQDRLAQSRRVRRWAEQDADTAIAVRRAEVRAARELRRQDDLLALPGHVEAETVDEEPAVWEDEPVTRQASTYTAAGTGSAGATATGSAGATAEPERRALESGTGSTRGELVPAERMELLDRLPGPLPVIGRVVTGMARPFVPGPVARLVADPTRPVRKVRTILDEVEEFQFSLLRRRKVTVTEEHEEPPAPADDPDPDPGLVEEPLQRVSVTQVHRESDAPGGRLTGGSRRAELEPRRRELPRG